MVRRSGVCEEGNYGDGRECYALQHVLSTVPENNPSKVIKALDGFNQRWRLLNLDSDKASRLDEAVQKALSLSFGSRNTRLVMLEIGTYIGYSSLRIGWMLAQATPHWWQAIDHQIIARCQFNEKTGWHDPIDDQMCRRCVASYEENEGTAKRPILISLEQNRDNYNVAVRILRHAGLLLSKTEIGEVGHVVILHMSFDQFLTRVQKDGGYEKIIGEHARLHGDGNQVQEHARLHEDGNKMRELLRDAIAGPDLRRAPEATILSLIFMDHQKSKYFTDLKKLEEAFMVDTGTVIVADNVASVSHLEGRMQAIFRKKRYSLCSCANKGCNLLRYLAKDFDYVPGRSVYMARGFAHISAACETQLRICPQYESESSSTRNLLVSSTNNADSISIADSKPPQDSTSIDNTIADDCTENSNIANSNPENRFSVKFTYTSAVYLGNCNDDESEYYKNGDGILVAVCSMAKNPLKWMAPA